MDNVHNVICGVKPWNADMGVGGVEPCVVVAGEASELVTSGHKVVSRLDGGHCGDSVPPVVAWVCLPGPGHEQGVVDGSAGLRDGPFFAAPDSAENADVVGGVAFVVLDGLDPDPARVLVLAGDAPGEVVCA